MESRRAFLGRCGASAAVWTALGAGGWSRLSAAAAFDARPARRAGGVRDGAGQGGRGRVRRHPDQPLSQPGRHVARPGRPRDGQAGRGPYRSPTSGSFGFGLRVLADGAWGFSASHEVTREAIARAADRGRRDRQGQRPAAPRSRSSWLPHHPTTTPTGPRSSPTRSRSRSSRSSSCSARSRPRRARSRGLLRDGLDRRSPRRPVLRLDRGERDRAARLPDLARVHRDRRRGRPQGQVAVLPAARRLRWL